MFFSNRPELYNYTHCAYAKPSYLFYGSSVIMSEDGTQQGDPEAPPLFAETIHTLVKQLESKINIWYLDDGNLADDYKVVLRDLKNILKSEQIYGLSLNTEKCELCFLGPTTSTQYNSILTQFRKICPKIKIKTKEELLILGSPIGELCRKELLDEKIRELEKISDVIDKLDAHYGFYLLKNCFSMPKLLYFLRTSPCFLQNDFLERYDKLLRNSLCKVTNVKMDDNQFLQAVLPAAKGGLGVSSARLLALPAFLASAVGAKDALSEIFGLEHVDGTYDDALKRWFDLGKIEMAPENEIQKNWTEPIFDSEIADLILRLEPTDVKRFNAFQDRFGSQWLNVIPCKNLRLKLSNQQLRIAIGLRLGSKICERHKCVCGKDVTEDGWHGLSCLKSAGRFSRHSNLNALIKQSLSSTHIPSVLEPRHLYRTDQKRPDGLTLVPWADGKQLLWDVTVVDSLAPCRINAGSVCNPGTAAAEAEERKIDKYKDLVNDGYLFQPLAFEIQGAAGPSTEVFLSKLCKNLSICTEEPRAGSFLKQRISLAIQIANAACVLGTINDKITFDEIFYL